MTSHAPIAAGTAGPTADVPADVPGDGHGVDCGGICRSRRSVLAAVGAVGAAALAGCQTYGGSQPVNNQPAAPPPAQSPAGEEPPAGEAPQGEEPAGGEAQEEAPPANALASVEDIPVGGGVIYADKGVVVTQPKSGTYKAFKAECTHAGCAVSEVKGGTINCNCHGSKFKVTDGSVAGGPAPSPLPEVGFKVTGNSIVLT